MKHLLLTTIAAVVLVGCATTQSPEPSIAEAPDISIHDAAADGNIEAVKHHLAAGADVNAKNGERCTPLHLAAGEGHKEVAELLVTKGADVSAKDEEGETPLDWAILLNQSETANLLRKHASKSSAEDSIHVAAMSGNIEAAKQHLAAGADVNTKDSARWTPLHFTAQFAQKEITELLISKGADVNAKNKRGVTPLDLADGEIADLLRRHGGKSGAEDSVHVAAVAGNIEAVKQHLVAGADVNAKGWREWTPLHLAALYDHKEIAELLIAKGADVNVKRRGGQTALDSADSEIADLLRKHGGKTGEELKAEGK